MKDTICAISTPAGMGAIALIRISGNNAWNCIEDCFIRRDKKTEIIPQKTYFGEFYDEQNLLDQVLITYFKSPHSFTGEDMIEISCHGSLYIQKRILEILIDKGCRFAKSGEFTMRAFMNGKMDLSQAEAVAEVIAADSKAALGLAMKHLRGGFSSKIKKLREQLLQFTSLLELELDFSEEDVEFADRAHFRELILQLKSYVSNLINSFQLGNAIKNGVSVAIIGKPNAGKSTLLNALLNEDRAIVSEIAGTTRDTIEETLNINGILFRLIDTAGIREHATDAIEKMGVEKSLERMRNANIVACLFDVNETTNEDIFLQKKLFEQENIQYILVGNKIDELKEKNIAEKFTEKNMLFISAKEKQKIDDLKQQLYKIAVGNSINTENTIVTNARHHAALLKIEESLNDIEDGIKNCLSGDLLAIDIRRALHYLGEITGQVEIDRDILGAIFGKFCIGK